MVSASIVRAANAQLPESLPNDLTAVLIGATSGIGLEFAQQFATATKGKSPRIYVVGRSAVAATPQLADLRQRNDSARVEFIEEDVSLVKNVDAVFRQVQTREEQVDLLFLSPGYIPFEGRKGTSIFSLQSPTAGPPALTISEIDTIEGLEPSMTTRYYSRIRAIQKFLPLLSKSAQPHVINVLAGGQEGPLDEQDLDLRKPGNFSFIKSSVHSGTMLTLALERLASENPSISFVHAFPGLTATPLLTRGSQGIAGVFLRWIVQPFLTTFVAASVASVAAKVLFYSTNARYTAPETRKTAAPLPTGLSVLRTTPRQLFLVGADGEATGDEKLLGDLRARVSEKVWEHTQEVFRTVI